MLCYACILQDLFETGKIGQNIHAGSTKLLGEHPSTWEEHPSAWEGCHWTISRIQDGGEGAPLVTPLHP